MPLRTCTARSVGFLLDLAFVVRPSHHDCCVGDAVVHRRASMLGCRSDVGVLFSTDVAQPVCGWFARWGALAVRELWKFHVIMPIIKLRPAHFWERQVLGPSYLPVPSR